jgi:hypothetical protein
MRNFIRAALNFSWTLPLFGVQQLGTALTRPGAAARSLDILTAAAESELDPDLRSWILTARRAQTAGLEIMLGIIPEQNNGSTAPTEAPSCTCKPSPPEEAVRFAGDNRMIRLSRGNATVRHGLDGKMCFITHGDLSRSGGPADGEMEGVWGAEYFSPEELTDYPKASPAIFERPFKPGEVLWKPHLNACRLRMTFEQGHDSLEAVGPGFSRIQVQSDHRTQFWYGITAFVTGTEGRYRGFQGLATCLGTAEFPSVPQPVEGLSFPIQAIVAIVATKTI